MDEVIDAIPNLSVITKIELLGYNSTREYYELVSDFIEDSMIYSLSDEIVDLSISLRKKYKMKVPDAIIAATAISLNYILVTRNVKDFSNIKSLKVINPWIE